ncbi:hypothetical protein Taro_045934 [Colocasia esculenta]|uniref:Uncharacterized protein n=1 Tax=Colocasia esculenta TaxID=4460 RepID=A0A843WNG2_COLES|nr:hypothetical protein [Colocasia esculenta]
MPDVLRSALGDRCLAFDDSASSGPRPDARCLVLAMSLACSGVVEDLYHQQLSCSCCCVSFPPSGYMCELSLARLRSVHGRRVWIWNLIGYTYAESLQLVKSRVGPEMKQDLLLFSWSWRPGVAVDLLASSLVDVDFLNLTTAHPRAALSAHSLPLLPQLRAPVSLKLLTGSEEWLDDRRTRGVAELREETSRRGAIPNGQKARRAGLGFLQGLWLENLASTSFVAKLLSQDVNGQVSTQVLGLTGPAVWAHSTPQFNVCERDKEGRRVLNVRVLHVAFQLPPSSTDRLHVRCVSHAGRPADVSPKKATPRSGERLCGLLGATWPWNEVLGVFSPRGPCVERGKRRMIDVLRVLREGWFARSGVVIRRVFPGLGFLPVKASEPPVAFRTRQADPSLSVYEHDTSGRRILKATEPYVANSAESVHVVSMCVASSTTPTVVTSSVGCPRFCVSQAVSSGLVPWQLDLLSIVRLSGRPV